MKRASTFFMLLFFLALSLWLSFKVKSHRLELSQVKTALAQSNSQNNLLSYHFDVLQEACDAELLLVASTGLITGQLPLELLKEEALFSGLQKDFI